MRDIAQLTELLFADQSLDDLLALIGKEAVSDRGWGHLTSAAAHLRQGEIECAKKLLLELSVSSNIETRVLLWTWAALNRLGVYPEPDEANDIKGIVVQVPMEMGFDVLAAYADGSARYVNHSGKVIVWDIADAAIGSTICQLLKSAAALGEIAVAASTRHFVADVIRVTLLRIDGNRVVETSVHSLPSGPINQVLALSLELMGSLIKRSKSQHQA